MNEMHIESMSEKRDFCEDAAPQTNFTNPEAFYSCVGKIQCVTGNFFTLDQGKQLFDFWQIISFYLFLSTFSAF